MNTIKQMFRVMLMAVTVAAAALALTLMMLGRANDRVAAVNKTRYDSYLVFGRKPHFSNENRPLFRYEDFLKSAISSEFVGI